MFVPLPCLAKKTTPAEAGVVRRGRLRRRARDVPETIGAAPALITISGVPCSAVPDESESVC
jgi:hypothetical protein